jgi:hypothetical protein
VGVALGRTGVRARTPVRLLVRARCARHARHGRAGAEQTNAAAYGCTAPDDHAGCQRGTSSARPRSKSPFIPGPAVFPRPVGTPRSPPAAPPRPGPAPRYRSHHPGPYVTRHQRGFTHVHPSGLPLACDPRMGRRPLGRSPSFTPRGHPRGMSGRARALNTGPELPIRHPPALQPERSLTVCDLVSHIPPVRGLQHDLRRLPGTGHHRPQILRIVGDPHRLQRLPGSPSSAPAPTAADGDRSRRTACPRTIRSRGPPRLGLG